MADVKKAKTAEKGGATQQKRSCPSCGADARVTLLTGWGPKGLFWMCDKSCGYVQRTR